MGEEALAGAAGELAQAAVEEHKLQWEIVKTIGQAAWDLMVSNQKLTNLEQQKVNAVPHVQDWTSVYGGQHAHPVDLHYSQDWYFTSSDTTTALVRVNYTCRSQYQHKGAYITEAWVDLIDADPTWWALAPDNVLNISVQVHGPENVGTPEDPVAAIGFGVHFNERSATGEEAHKNYLVWVYGDGRNPDVQEG